MIPMPPWDIVEPKLRLIVVPGLIVGAIVYTLLAVGLLERYRRMAAPVGGAAGLAAGNVASYLGDWWTLSSGYPALFPAMFIVLLGACFSGLFDERQLRIPAFLVRLLITMLTAVWLTSPGENGLPILSAAILFVITLVNWELLRSVYWRALGCLSPVILAFIWCGTAALVLIAAHSARFSDIATLISVALLGPGLAGLIFRRDQSSLLALPAIGIAGLVLDARVNTFSDVPAAAFYLTAMAPWGLLLLLIPGLRNGKMRWQRVAAIAGILIPCIIAAALALSYESLDFGNEW